MMTATGAGLAAGVAGCTGGGGQATESPTEGDGAGESKYTQPGDTGNEAHILTDYSNDPWQNIWNDEIASPLEPTSSDLAQTPATAYAGRFPILSEMTNQVIVEGRDPEKAWEEAHGRFEKRLQEGKDIVAENL